MARKPKKERLDKLLVARSLAPTRAKAQAYIMAGEVRVNGEVVLKAGSTFSADSTIDLATPMPYVGRGGYKLAEAITQFNLTLTDRICADVGACTGGFTDVMLQNGAARVYAIDVGYGQLDWKLRQDERVVVMERTNVRYVESVSEPVSFVAIDVSFISLSLVLPAVKKWLTPSFDIVTLVKPQFEAGKTQVGKGGIVRDPAVHRSVLDTITTWATANDLYPHGLIVSPITGSNGNKEFLLWLRAAPSPTFDYAQTATESVA